MNRDKDYARFGMALGGAALAFGLKPEEITAQRIEVYYRALDDLPVEEVERAVGSCIKGLKFFPKPAEIRERTPGGDRETAATVAMNQLRRAIDGVGPDSPVDFGDPALHAVVEQVGGWREVSMWKVRHGDQLGFELHKVRALYLRALDHPSSAPAVLNDAPALRNPLKRIGQDGRVQTVGDAKALTEGRREPPLEIPPGEVKALVDGLVARSRLASAPRLRALPPAPATDREPTAEERAAFEARRAEALARFRGAQAPGGTNAEPAPAPRAAEPTATRRRAG